MRVGCAVHRGDSPTTLTEVGGQQLDYAPLQLALHDPRLDSPPIAILF